MEELSSDFFIVCTSHKEYHSISGYTLEMKVAGVCRGHFFSTDQQCKWTFFPLPINVRLQFFSQWLSILGPIHMNQVGWGHAPTCVAFEQPIYLNGPHNTTMDLKSSFQHFLCHSTPQCMIAKLSVKGSPHVNGKWWRCCDSVCLYWFSLILGSNWCSASWIVFVSANSRNTSSASWCSSISMHFYLFF